MRINTLIERQLKRELTTEGTTMHESSEGDLGADHSQECGLVAQPQGATT
jgi:hypothetical protein